MYTPRKVGEFIQVRYYGNDTPAFLGQVSAIIHPGEKPDKALMDRLFYHRRESTSRQVYAPVKASKHLRVVVTTKTGNAYAYTLSDKIERYFDFTLVDEWGKPIPENETTADQSGPA